MKWKSSGKEEMQCCCPLSLHGFIPSSSHCCSARARARLEAQKANAVPAAPPPPMVFAPMVFEEVEDVEVSSCPAVLLSGGCCSDAMPCSS